MFCHCLTYQLHIYNIFSAMKHKILAIFKILVPGILFSPLAVWGSTVADTVVPQSFEYVLRDGKPLMLDFYKPAAPRPDSACLVYLFGGGFYSGSRQNADVRLYCQSLAARGFAAVAIDYTLHLRSVNYDTVNLFNMTGVFRQAINMAAADCAAAVDFICRHAEEWGIAANRIVLCGGSAGAISVLQLDYCRANSLPAASELPQDWQPAAVVAYAGAIFAEKGNPSYATPPAPTFFLNGTKDKIVNYRKFPPVLRTGLYGAKKIQKTFRKNNYSHWIFRYDGIGHEIASLHNYTLPEMEAFVDATLAGRQMSYDATVRDNNVRPSKWTTMNVFDLYSE